jgi:hypothetical protein
MFFEAFTEAETGPLWAEVRANIAVPCGCACGCGCAQSRGCMQLCLLYNDIGQCCPWVLFFFTALLLLRAFALQLIHGLVVLGALAGSLSIVVMERGRAFSSRHDGLTTSTCRPMVSDEATRQGGFGANEW